MYIHLFSYPIILHLFQVLKQQISKDGAYVSLSPTRKFYSSLDINRPNNENLQFYILTRLQAAHQ